MRSCFRPSRIRRQVVLLEGIVFQHIEKFLIIYITGEYAVSVSLCTHGVSIVRRTDGPAHTALADLQERNVLPAFRPSGRSIPAHASNVADTSSRLTTLRTTLPPVKPGPVMMSGMWMEASWHVRLYSASRPRVRKWLP